MPYDYLNKNYITSISYELLSQEIEVDIYLIIYLVLSFIKNLYNKSIPLKIICNKI